MYNSQTHQSFKSNLGRKREQQVGAGTVFSNNNNNNNNNIIITSIIIKIIIWVWPFLKWGYFFFSVVKVNTFFDDDESRSSEGALWWRF